MKFNTTTLLVAVIGILALATSSTHAQGEEECVLRCDEGFSQTLTDCIVPYKGKPKNPARIKCLEDTGYRWLNCKENCYP
ncbi:hypothetical protein BGZ73_005716 [Actinomortierella ambigua]|nr:hypothetical protein BGZ73_005716 [Actinomortierella ambigua]